MCFREEADEYVDIGALNGIFVLGRSMGFIGELAVVSRVSCYTPCPVCVSPYSRCQRLHHHSFVFSYCLGGWHMEVYIILSSYLPFLLIFIYFPFITGNSFHY